MADFTPRPQQGDENWFETREAYDASLEAAITEAAEGASFGAGTWNGGNLRLGDYRLWVDATGDLRIKNGDPASDTDGVVVGTQS